MKYEKTVNEYYNNIVTDNKLDADLINIISKSVIKYKNLKNLLKIMVSKEKNER